MHDGLALFDPEIEHLLSEVAADPDSYLLRIPRNPRAHRAYELEAGLSLRTAGLRPAEHHLLSHFRAELAEFFRQAFNYHVGLSERLRSNVAISDPLSDRVRPLSSMQIEVKARVLSQLGSGGRLAANVTRALDSLASGNPPEVIENLPMLSLVCRPNDEARICLAVAFLLSGRSKRARRILRSIIVNAPERRARAYALVNFGWAERRDRNLIGTAEMDAAAIAESPSWVVPHIDRFIALVQLGLERSAREAGQAIEYLDNEAEATIDSHVVGLRNQIALGDWQIPRFVRERAVRLMDKLGVRAGRLLGVLAKEPEDNYS